jgi:hypothetical protein
VKPASPKSGSGKLIFTKGTRLAGANLSHADLLDAKLV